MAEPLYVSFLWHMHQPFYKDPVQGEYILPWTYLHAIKDYYDMPAIVDATPGARVVFNLVPSLLEQILDYAAGTAVDPFLTRARMAPEELNEDEKLFMLENFFSANRQRMIEPHKRYLELYCLAGDGAPEAGPARLRGMRDQDLLDLQVWFYLSWTGEAARRRFPVFQELIRKGKQFTAADKLLLFETQSALIAEIIPLYKKLHEEGKAELSVTPYFHPILPLLCDSQIAKIAMPKVNLPGTRFQHSEDARGQVAQGIESFEKIFGFTPAGMWPSEGSVSDETLCIMAEKGLTWSATDEWVLGQTLPGGLGKEREALYHPYTFQQERGEIALFFRDHGLSDLISFTYSQWETERAVADFIGKLKEVRQRSRSSQVVPIIMDGENAWEYFQDNGFPFLSKLYGALAQTPGLKAATFSEVLQLVPERQVLGRIHPGSWINANYGIWIGHPEENLAWELLARARAAAVEQSPMVASLLAGEVGGGCGELGRGRGEQGRGCGEQGRGSGEQGRGSGEQGRGSGEQGRGRGEQGRGRGEQGRGRGEQGRGRGDQCCELGDQEDERDDDQGGERDDDQGGERGEYQAGADCCVGHDCSEETARLVCKSLHAAEGSDWFWWYGDDHFSAHAGSFDLLFRRHLMNVYQLLNLEVPSVLYEPIKKQFPAGFVREPSALITPEITGIVTDYFEWLAAGLYDLTKQASAMHAAENLLQSFFYGFDRSYFYLRIDGVQSLEKTFQQDDCLSLHLIHGSEFRLDMELGASIEELRVKGPSGWRPSGIVAEFCIGRIIEARIPLSALQLTPGDKLFTYFTYTRSRDELGRWPVDIPFLLNYAGPELEFEQETRLT
jgi:alpha-amylase/alpha-mannosidase (GH57 family)